MLLSIKKLINKNSITNQSTRTKSKLITGLIAETLEWSQRRDSPVSFQILAPNWPLFCIFILRHNNISGKWLFQCKNFVTATVFGLKDAAWRQGWNLKLNKNFEIDTLTYHNDIFESFYVFMIWLKKLLIKYGTLSIYFWPLFCPSLVWNFSKNCWFQKICC